MFIRGFIVGFLFVAISRSIDLFPQPLDHERSKADYPAYASDDGRQRAAGPSALIHCGVDGVLDWTLGLMQFYRVAKRPLQPGRNCLGGLEGGLPDQRHLPFGEFRWHVFFSRWLN